MLREQVLREWNGCKEKIKKERKISEFVADKINGGGVLPNIISLGSDLNAIEANLSKWTTLQYQNKIKIEKDEVANKAEELDNHLTTIWQLAYLNSANIFERLALGWWREKRNDVGPIIEEWSD